MQQSIPEGPPQPLNIHGIMLKGKPDENWGQLLAPLISQWNNRAEFRVDVYPRQKGLLSFNFDYMVWYKQKMKMFVDLKNANTTTLKQGDIAAEEILIVKREDRIDHVTLPHVITNIIMNDIHVSV
ncbi:hypothetical protein GmHk_14G041820 [Glycine max]|nr:hypothetical protein GmHk_14G041820 [Glycine max]